MQPEQTDLGNMLTDEAVLRFLATNPEFFVNNEEILPRLRIPHSSGNAVSLIEKQVSVLRNKCGTLENSLRDLIAVARDNENLHQRLHVLIQDVISAPSIEEIVGLTQASLCANFNADDVHMLLIDAKPAKSAARKTAKKVDSAKSAKATAARAAAASRRKLNAIEGLQIFTHNDKRLDLFAQLFDVGDTACGLPSTEHLECFVGNEYSNIASAALIPLFHERQLGIVMLTSRDESRFASGKGVMFLNQLGELLGRRLHSYSAFAPVAKK